MAVSFVFRLIIDTFPTISNNRHFEGLRSGSEGIEGAKVMEVVARKWPFISGWVPKNMGRYMSGLFTNRMSLGLAKQC